MTKNIIANIIGKFWSILSNYLFIPLYISLLGIENYAVISFSFILIGIMGLLDAGLTATLSREFAKKEENKSGAHKLHILNTLESCYWIVVLLIILIVLGSSGIIAEKWLTLKSLDGDYVATALKMFGVAMALQLLANFYAGGLIGLERQVKANIFQIVWGVFRNGLVLVVIFFKPSLIYFFAWQAAVTLIYVVILRYVLINSIKRDQAIESDHFVFDKKILRTVGKFVGGMLLISIVAAINTQLDKIAISKMLPINELAYYNLGTALTQGIIVLITPISIALLPRFTSLYSLKKGDEASKLFFTTIMFVSILIFSIAAIIMFNANELILVWTGNSELALASSKYVFYLAFGTAMLAIQYIPFNIAIANGYTRINNVLGITSLFFSIPGYWLSVYYFGPQGAAITWCLIQTITTPVYLYYINKRFITYGNYSSLLFKQIIKPAAAALLIAFLFNLICPHINNRILELLLIGLSTIVTLMLVALVAIPIEELKQYWAMVRSKLSFGERN